MWHRRTGGRGRRRGQVKVSSAQAGSPGERPNAKTVLSDRDCLIRQRLSYPTETVLSNKITRNRIVLSFKDSSQKPLRQRPPLPPSLSGCCCLDPLRRLHSKPSEAHSCRNCPINAAENSEVVRWGNKGKEREGEYSRLHCCLWE